MAGRSSPATRSWRCRRRGCTPTGIRWRANRLRRLRLAGGQPGGRTGRDGRRGAAASASVVPAGDRAAARAGWIKGMAHITGGGITDNLPRVLPDGLSFSIDRDSWIVPPLFPWLQRAGGLDDAEMMRTFNMGVGTRASSRSPRRCQQAIACASCREAWVIGHVDRMRPACHYVATSRAGALGVLISGRGSNLQALIDAQRDGELARRHRRRRFRTGRMPADWSARERRASRRWCSLTAPSPPARTTTRALVGELRRAQRRAGLPRRVHAAGRSANSATRSRNAILNIHPSLLPAFPGRATRSARRSTHGVKVTGATVHFVTPELDAGPIVLQEAVAVHDEDTRGLALGADPACRAPPVPGGRPAGPGAAVAAGGSSRGVSSGCGRRGAGSRPGILIWRPLRERAASPLLLAIRRSRRLRRRPLIEATQHRLERVARLPHHRVVTP